MSDVTLRAVYDANILYDAHVRDFCLWLAVSGAVEARWTNAIHDEWTKHLTANRPDLDPGKIVNVRALMDRAVPDCLVFGYESRIESIELPDENDRHVLAAAITCDADVIVTFNLSDFPASALQPYSMDNER